MPTTNPTVNARTLELTKDTLHEVRWIVAYLLPVSTEVTIKLTMSRETGNVYATVDNTLKGHIESD